MTDLPQVTDTMTYEVADYFAHGIKDWRGDYHVMKIIKQTEKAVYCTIENENYFGFDTWIPKSCLVQVEREAPKSCVREIGDAGCKWVVFGKMSKGYADWESALKYIRYSAKKYGMKYICDINLNKRYISLSTTPFPRYDTGIGRYDWLDDDFWESDEERRQYEVGRIYGNRSPCATERASSYFKEE